MAATYILEIYTAEKPFLKAKAQSSIIPGADGYFGVLAHHARLIAGLAPGKLYIRFDDGAEKLYALSGGVAEVASNVVTILADAVEEPSHIDRERAQKALERAKERLGARDPEVDVARAEIGLKRALNRLRVADVLK